jgi:uncharacterized protein YceK
MKRSLLIVFAVLIIIQGCVSLGPSKTMPLRGKYAVNKTTILKGSFDDVWQQAIVFLAAHNFSITVIDKASGFIQTGTLNMGTTTTETPNGELKSKKSRFVGDVVQTYYTKKQIDTLNPHTVRAAYYVTFSTVKDSVRVIHGFTSVSNQITTDRGGNIKSTGLFERKMDEYLQAAVK